MSHLQYNHISDIMTEIINAEYVCVGSPTLNNNILSNVASFLTYLKGLAPKKRKAIVFGSYRWGGQSIGQINDFIKDSGFDVVESIRVNYIPTNEDLIKIKDDLSMKIR